MSKPLDHPKSFEHEPDPTITLKNILYAALGAIAVWIALVLWFSL